MSDTKHGTEGNWPDPATRTSLPRVRTIQIALHQSCVPLTRSHRSIPSKSGTRKGTVGKGVDDVKVFAQRKSDALNVWCVGSWSFSGSASCRSSAAPTKSGTRKGTVGERGDDVKVFAQRKSDALNVWCVGSWSFRGSASCCPSAAPTKSGTRKGTVGERGDDVKESAQRKTDAFGMWCLGG